MDPDLDGGQVNVPAASARARRDQSVPLRADLLRALAEKRGKLPSAMGTDLVFSRAVFPSVRTLHRDLAGAGMAREDQSGRVVDFHSLRVTFVSNLAAAGVHPRTAQALARHSSIELTMRTYTDLSRLDLRGAVEKVPSALNVAEPPSESRSPDIGLRNSF